MLPVGRASTSNEASKGLCCNSTFTILFATGRENLEKITSRAQIHQG